jgi:hypothetical protein
MIASQKEALDQARKHREEAEKATSAKSNFLASMSHELRQVVCVSSLVWMTLIQLLAELHSALSTDCWIYWTAIKS